MSANQVLLVANASEELAGILRSASWEIRPAQSLHEALTQLSAQSAPVVICERALADGEWKDLLGKTPRLIVTSRVTDEALWAEVLNLGGYDVLAQPFDAEEVRRVVALAGGLPETLS